jgi:hypothetical protein
MLRATIYRTLRWDVRDYRMNMTLRQIKDRYPGLSQFDRVGDQEALYAEQFDLESARPVPLEMVQCADE